MVPFWREEALPKYKAEIARRQEMVIEQLTTAELWREIQEVLDAAMDYLGTLMFATMGASAGSEGLLTNVYNKMVKREGDPHATTLVMGYNSIPVQAEKSLYDLAKWCSERQELTTHFLSTPSGKLVVELKDEQPPSGVNLEDWQGAAADALRSI